MNDDLGDRMKGYEAIETERRLDTQKPIYARIDGRSFSRFTRGMQRPFDAAMTTAMIDTTKHLVESTHAKCGYTQSDEISLAWLAEGEDADTIFSGKVQKLASVLASMTTAKFSRVCPLGYEDRLPHFDCRVFQLPDVTEGANCFLWRVLDCKKNAVSMVARAHFSHKQLHGQGQNDMLAMLEEKGVEFDSYPAASRYGTFVRRLLVNRDLTAEEMASIPEQHRPVGPVLRHDTETISLPFWTVTNREEFIFSSSSPAFNATCVPLQTA